jgi:hypothetical protein
MPRIRKRSKLGSRVKEVVHTPKNPRRNERKEAMVEAKTEYNVSRDEFQRSCNVALTHLAMNRVDLHFNIGAMSVAYTPEEQARRGAELGIPSASLASIVDLVQLARKVSAAEKAYAVLRVAR